MWYSGKEPACACWRHKWYRFNAWVGKVPWNRNGNPLQYSCLENSIDRRTWQATVHEIAKSWTWLSNWPCYFLSGDREWLEHLYNKSITETYVLYVPVYETSKIHFLSSRSIQFLGKTKIELLTIQNVILRSAYGHHLVAC